MFGKNPVAPRRDAQHKLLVKDIFYTIQGEGPYAGHPAVFIRLGGCNLQCSFCDTDFTTDLKEMSPYEIFQEVHKINIGARLIVVTGGEPLLQNVYRMLKEFGGQSEPFTGIQFETAGTVWPKDGMLEHLIDDEEMPLIDFVCSPKTPKINETVRRHLSAWKYVINIDTKFAADGFPVELAKPDAGSRIPVYLSPMDEYAEGDNIIAAASRMGYPRNDRTWANIQYARDACLKYGHLLSLQTHKIIEVP